MLFAFQVCRRGSDDTAFGFGLCVDTDGPGERECWAAWNLVEGRFCHDCEKILDKLHTLHTSSFPLRVPLDVRVYKVRWLLVLVVAVGEHLQSTVMVSGRLFTLSRSSGKWREREFGDNIGLPKNSRQLSLIRCQGMDSHRRSRRCRWRCGE